MPTFQGDPAVYDSLAREGLTPERIQAELSATTDERVLFRRFNFLWYIAEQYDLRNDTARIDLCLSVLDEVETELKKRYRPQIQEAVLGLLDNGELAAGVTDLVPIATEQRLGQCIAHYNPDSEISFTDYLQRALTEKTNGDVQAVAVPTRGDPSVVLDPVKSREAKAEALVAEALNGLTDYQKVVMCLTEGWQRQLKAEWIHSNRWQEELGNFFEQWDGTPISAQELSPYLKAETTVEAKTNAVQAIREYAQRRIVKWVREQLKGDLLDPAREIRSYLNRQPNRDQAVRELLGLTGTPGAHLTDLQKFYVCLFLDLREYCDLRWLPADIQARFSAWKAGREERPNLSEIGRRMEYGVRTEGSTRVNAHRARMFERVLTYLQIKTGEERVGTTVRNQDAERDEFFRRLEDEGQLKVLLEANGERSVLSNDEKIVLCFTQGLRRYLDWNWVEDETVRERLKQEFSNWMDGEVVGLPRIARIMRISQSQLYLLRDSALDSCQDWESVRRGEPVIEPRTAVAQLAQQTDRVLRLGELVSSLPERERRVFCVRYGFPEGLSAEERIDLIGSRKWAGVPIVSRSGMARVLDLTNPQVAHAERSYLKRVKQVLSRRNC